VLAGIADVPVIRLDRWTGTIVVCGGLEEEWEIRCSVEDRPKPKRP
jgi:hypothetical protein